MQNLSANIGVHIKNLFSKVSRLAKFSLQKRRIEAPYCEKSKRVLQIPM